MNIGIWFPDVPVPGYRHRVTPMLKAGALHRVKVYLEMPVFRDLGLEHSVIDLVFLTRSHLMVVYEENPAFFLLISCMPTDILRTVIATVDTQEEEYWYQ